MCDLSLQAGSPARPRHPPGLLRLPGGTAQTCLRRRLSPAGPVILEELLQASSSRHQAHRCAGCASAPPRKQRSSPNGAAAGRLPCHQLSAQAVCRSGRAPRRAGIKSEQRRLTYAELNQRANQLARRLFRPGCRSGCLRRPPAPSGRRNSSSASWVFSKPAAPMYPRSSVPA